MPSPFTKESHHERALESLAVESQVPVNQVARLYEDVHAELAAGARIRRFIGIFALRKVRRTLLERGRSAIR